MNANEFLASILCLSAVYLRSWSFAVLDHHFTYAVRILEGHRLVGTAPYSVLIHPSYTGLVLASIGYIWFMGFRRLQFLGFVCFMIAATVMRIRDEEQVLAQHFGAEWDAHIKGKSRLIPHVW
ncbi:hypothetical protein BC828DRAFT_347416 [Blastocladiella britannica]|nr:hypothetical protein BC828DRAFT_347416 [Blastocladiella britannica]